MASRYTSESFTSASVSAGATLNINRTGLADKMDLFKIKVVPDAPGGSFDFKIYKADTFAAAKLLAFWDDVAPNLYAPMDISSGVPAEGLEGPAIPYDDDDASAELHLQIVNNDGVAHTYTVTILWEVPAGASIAESAITFTDITTNDSATSKHGFLKKLSNIATEFMNGQGAWATPASGMQYADSRFEFVQSSRDMTAATGTQAITGAGFAPKAVIIYGAKTETAVSSFGFGESTGPESWCIIAPDGAGTTGEFTVEVTVISLREAAGGSQKATIQSFDADGITLSWTKSGSPTGSGDFGILFLR